MDICRVNRSFKVCMKKGPACQTHTPPSSLPELNITLIYFLYCPTATLFLNRFSWAQSTSLYLAYHNLMNIVAAEHSFLL